MKKVNGSISCPQKIFASSNISIHCYGIIPNSIKERGWEGLNLIVFLLNTILMMKKAKNEKEAKNIRNFFVPTPSRLYACPTSLTIDLYIGECRVYRTLIQL